MFRNNFRNLAYTWSLLPGVLVIAGNFIGGNFVYANIIFVFGILCVLEWFVPENKSNSFHGNSFVPDLILISHVFLQLIAISSLFYAIQLNKLSGWQLIGAAVSTGLHSGTSAIVVAHELIHRKNKLFRTLGKVLLFSAGNTYFYIEHLRVHHKWVGTDKDPATARKNESLYAFFLRSMFGQISNAYRLEKNRLASVGKHSLIQNELIRNFIFQLMLFSLIGFFFGIIMVLAFALQILIANFLLEYTNYIEHYGLSRNENERVREDLSWQTDKVISRFLLIDLSRHSDHHYFASKPFHTLQSYQGSPILPGGYASAIYLALIPALWFKVVNNVLEHFIEEKNKKVA